MASMVAAWPTVALSEVLFPVDRAETPVVGKAYRTIGVKWWGEGVYERDTIDGSQTQYSILRRIQAGDIIINKIWARHGSVAVVQPVLDGCYASTEFPTWTARPDRLEPRWMHWLSKTRAFWTECDEKSRGTSGKNRIRPERFLEIEIPLPPLDEQRRIVARIEALAARIAEVRGLRQAAMAEAEALRASARATCFGSEPASDWIPLRAYVHSIENGWSPACENRPASDEEWGVLKVGAVSFGSYNAKENKALPTPLQPDARYEVRTGDFLMSRANTRELVGACALVETTPPRLMLSDKIFRFRFHDGVGVDLHYLDHVMKSPAIRDQIERRASGTSPTMKNISKAAVLDLLVPPISFDVQSVLSRYLDAISAQVDTLRALQGDSAAEVDTLLPALLDRAFRGEL